MAVRIQKVPNIRLGEGECLLGLFRQNALVSEKNLEKFRIRKHGGRKPTWFISLHAMRDRDVNLGIYVYHMIYLYYPSLLAERESASRSEISRLPARQRHEIFREVFLALIEARCALQCIEFLS